MRELAKDKGRLEDIVEYSSNVLKIIEGIDFERFENEMLAEKYLKDINWDEYLNTKQ